MHDAGAIAVENQFAPADRPRDEVAVAGDPRTVAEIEPAAVEDGAPLRFQHGLLGKGPPRDAEQVPLAILDDHLRRGQDGVHVFLPIGRPPGLWRIFWATTIPNSC